MTDATRTIEEKWDLTYRHAAGPVVSHFYDRLQSDGVLVGRRCPQCTRVLVPPRSFCDRCYVDTEDWIEVGPEGVVETFTVVYREFQSLPEPPYAMAYVRLDGADTAILNYVRGLDLREPVAAAAALRPGTRARLVVDEPQRRQGRITDFWFELLP
ncbi:MAG: DNA-binding protein [Micromonosporaceae bacterium]|nr:DNA-binding protein [Micromonosporaceae bacterium]